MKTQFYKIAFEFHDSQSIIMDEIKDCLYRVGINQFGVSRNEHIQLNSIGIGLPFNGSIKRIGRDKHSLVIQTDFEPFAMDLGHEIRRCIEQKKLQMVNVFHQNTFASLQEKHFPDLLIDLTFIGIKKDTKRKIYKCTVQTNKLVDQCEGTFDEIYHFADGLYLENYVGKKDFAIFDHDKLILN